MLDGAWPRIVTTIHPTTNNELKSKVEENNANKHFSECWHNDVGNSLVVIYEPKSIRAEF